MADNLIGRTLLNGEYRLSGVLGRGGMATVYRAYSRSLETDVAVKVLPVALARDPGFRERFHDEARSLAALHHPNLVEVHHYGEEGDLVYIVMRLVPGGTLKNRLEAIGVPLDALTTARLIAQVADALQLAHSRGLVHLDIKPANILLGRSDWPLLADFGITRAVRNLRSARGQERMAGTPLYMSPEQCRGGPVDGRSDQYSLAITAYEMLTGRRPFQGETTEALLQHHLEDPPPRPREVNPGIPGPIEDVLLKALSKSPDDRFPSVRDFAAALADVAERTRGISLEAKAAVAGVAPNLLAVFALLLLAPVLFAILPTGALLGRTMPLTWPFQLLVSVLVAGLLLGVRWHLIGLLARALGAAVDVVASAGAALRPTGARSHPTGDAKPTRNAVVGSAEGCVNLVYLFVIYRLIAVPAIAMVSDLLGPAANRSIATGLTVIVISIALGIVVTIYRSSGVVVAAFTLGAGWAFVNVLPIGEVAAASGVSLAWTLKAVIGVGVLVVLLVTRSQTLSIIRRLALASLGRLTAELRPGATPEEVAVAREQMVRVICAAVDFLYLLVGYGLLRTPLLQALESLTGLVAAAILISGLAALIWLLLTIRLNAIAGGVGLALAILLGAPILVSLPAFEAAVTGLGWPAVAATWVVGTVLILVLASIRGQVGDAGRHALGPVIDRRLLGVAGTRTEDHYQQRIGALGGIVGALIDVAFLVFAYWVLGEPAAAALGRVTGRSGIGSLLLLALVVACFALLIGPLHHAVVTVEETNGSYWSGRLRAIPALAAALIALAVAGCAATPLALAAPDVAGGIALQSPSDANVIVNWAHWLPWTPARDQATYEIALSCPDGRQFGQFREAVQIPAGAVMPSGNVGDVGATQISCQNWANAYFAQRQLASLPRGPSMSVDWLDVRATLRPDRSVDVVETLRVLFTYGSFNRVSWSLTVGKESGEITGLQVSENGQVFAPGPARGVDRFLQTSLQNGQEMVTWSFPTVTSPDERIYSISYHLKDGIRSVGSGSRFERLVLPPNRFGPAWRTTVEVILPVGAQSNAVKLSANGASSQFGVVNSRTAAFEAHDVPTGTGLDVIVDFPSLGGAVPPPVTPTRTATPTPAPKLTATAEAQAMPAATATSIPTVAPNSTPTTAPTATNPSTPTATNTATSTSTATVALTVTATNTRAAATATPTSAPVVKSCANVPVLAMYYDWYDLNTWTSGKTSDQPVTPYVSADRSTIERQVTEAQGAGIDGFEVNWWGPGNQTDTNLQTLLSVAGGHGFKVTVDFDLNSPFVHSPADIVSDLKYLQRYYGNPAWFHYDGKPYIVFYATRKYDVPTWGSILRQVDPNHQVLWIAEGDIFSYLTAFDGIHPYSIAWSPDPSNQLSIYASRTRAYAGKIWMATVMPGYNDKLVNGAQGFSVDRQNGAYYTTMWQGAIATHPDVLSITSFNEWVEGSMMEPSKSYGDLYLQLTKQMVAKYQSALHPCG